GVLLIVNVRPLGWMEFSMFRLAGAVLTWSRGALSPSWLGVVFIGGGLLAVFAGLQGTVRAIAGALLPPGQHQLVDVLAQQRQRRRGPRIVVIGGGTGLSTLLRGLKEFTNNLTAVVTVFDDGGSSGRLRRELGILPPGDIRDCLVALAESEPLMTQLFEYRFQGGALDGHAFGNLFIASLAGVTGDLESAVKETSKVLNIRGQGRRVYVCNVMTQPGETDGFSSSDHVRVLRELIGPRLFTHVLVNTRRPRNRALLARYEAEGARPVEPDLEAIRAEGVVPIGDALISEEHLVRHEPRLVARALLHVLETLPADAQVAAL